MEDGGGFEKVNIFYENYQVFQGKSSNRKYNKKGGSMMSNKAREGIVRQKKKGYPLVQSVLLRQASGSGSELVDEAPSEEWIEQVRYLQFQEDTAHMCLVIAPHHKYGYEGCHGCELVFLPGDQDGMHMDEKSGKWFHIRRDRDDFSEYMHGFIGSGNFALCVSFKDLQNIHKAIGRALMSMGRFKNKPK